MHSVVKLVICVPSLRPFELSWEMASSSARKRSALEVPLWLAWRSSSAGRQRPSLSCEMLTRRQPGSGRSWPGVNGTLETQ